MKKNKNPHILNEDEIGNHNSADYSDEEGGWAG